MLPEGQGEQVVGVAEVEGELDLPQELPILPLRSATAFPNTILPLSIGRPKTLKLVNDVLVESKPFGLFSQKAAETEDPGPDDVYQVGSAAKAIRMLRMPDGGVRVLAQGLARIRIVEFVRTEPYLVARIERIEEKEPGGVAVEALVRNVRTQFTRMVSLSPYMSQEMEIVALNLNEPGRLADFVAASLNLPVADKQQLLEESDAVARLEKASGYLQREIEVLELSSRIQSQVQDEVSKVQKEHFLRMQMEAIKRELGESDDKTKESEELRSKIEAANMPDEVQQAARAELERLSRMHPSAAEFTVVRTYLDWLVSMPWAKGTRDRIDIKRARKILDADHFDLEKVKDRIIEFLAVRKLRRDTRGPILCFLGPPGVGKTSLGMSIARSMGRKFTRISLGGVRDEAEIRGHRRTYVGALPGRIIQGIRKVGTNNPVFMLDEVDKLGIDFRGDPSSALLEVLDPQQNFSFSDHYLDVPFDLSKVMFICTANVVETIPPALRDRMEVIELPGYAQEDKIEIAKRHLLPRQIKEHGLTGRSLVITDEALNGIVRDYTREAGVRNLERELAAVCRKAATRIVDGSAKRIRVEAESLSDFLGQPRFFSEVAERTSAPGVAIGLAWTPYGGEIMFIESTAMPDGKGQLILTGHLGDIMRESARAALSYIRTYAKDFDIEAGFFLKRDIHIHVPAGAIPKDGPSAGSAIAVSLASLAMGRAVKSHMAVSGEITLRGKVLPVGGVKEKILAAKRSGITDVILPRHNENDVKEVVEVARKGLNFHYVDTIREVVKLALPPVGRAGRKDATRTTRVRRKTIATKGR